MAMGVRGLRTAKILFDRGMPRDRIILGLMTEAGLTYDEAADAVMTVLERTRRFAWANDASG